MPVVLDSSAAIHLILNTQAGSEVGDAIRARGGPLYVPDHFLAEVGQGLRNQVRRGTCPADRAWNELLLLEQEVIRVGIVAFLWQAWQWREHETFQDMLFVAVAQEREATLVTCDRGQAQAAGEVGVPVDHIPSMQEREGTT